jgi:hypothetical protein
MIWYGDGFNMRAVESNWYIIQSRNLFWGLTSFSNDAPVLNFQNALHAMPTSFSACSYLGLQPNYDVLDKLGYARILLSI